MIVHVGLESDDEIKTDEFYIEVMGMQRKGSFVIPGALCKSIFGIDNEIEAVTYSRENLELEVFISSNKEKSTYGHVCVDVDDRKAFIENCRKHGIEPVSAWKKDKEIIFIKDFSGNQFEIKEKAK